METGQEVEIDVDKQEMDDYLKHVKGSIMRYNEAEEEKEEVDEDFNNKKIGQSRKAYVKELKAVVEESDVVIEVLDARDPLG